MTILITRVDGVCVLPNGFILSSKKIKILQLYIIPPNFIEIGQELFEKIDSYTQTHSLTDTYTPMKIIPVQKQSFWARKKNTIYA